MKTITLVSIAGLALTLMLGAHTTTARADAASPSFWVTGYYAGYTAVNTLKPKDIDLKPLTHVIFFSLLPTAAGGLDGGPNVVNDITTPEITQVVHKAGKKVLICIGGENTGPEFEQAISPAVRATFVKNIVDWTIGHSMDGVDIDMEPTTDADAPNYQAFMHDLRTALRAKLPDSLLTAAVGISPTIYAPILGDVDQINVMTYDLAGPWPEWETWYTSAPHNGGRLFKSVHKPMPACDIQIQKWLDGGTPAGKLGLGISAWGLAWHGATGPNQPIEGVTTEKISYADLMDKYYKPGRYHFDDGPDAAYLSVVGKSKADNVFVAFDDQKTIAEKIAYAKKTGLGGVIIWELGGTYRPNQPAGKRDIFLQSVGKALAQ